MRILVKRTGALGDVLEATPIVARLRAQYPDARIDFDTHYAEVFRGNTNINAACQAHDIYDRVINLNMAFENDARLEHPINSYSMIAFGDHATSHELEFRWEPFGGVNPRTVVLHPARSWPIRTLPREFWQLLINALVYRGFMVALTGTTQDWDGLTNCIDLRSKLSLARQCGLIDAACCFVCSESGPMILAQVTRTPIIPLLTMVPPEHVIHDRYGAQPWRWHPMRAKVPCVGCAAEQSQPTTYFDCKHPNDSVDFRRCVSTFDPVEVAEEVKRVHVLRAL